MNKDDNKKAIAEIEKIYKDYKDKMHELKVEQNKLISEYIAKLEEKKKEEIMKKLNQ